MKASSVKVPRYFGVRYDSFSHNLAILYLISVRLDRGVRVHLKLGQLGVCADFSTPEAADLFDY